MKRIEKEKKRLEKQALKQNPNHIPTNFWEDCEGSIEGGEMWWCERRKQCLNELLADYKYPLQKILSEDQILNLRKMALIDAQSANAKENDKEKSYSRCESKKFKESQAPRENERPRRTAAAIANIQMSSGNPANAFRTKNSLELVEVQRYLNEHQ